MSLFRTPTGSPFCAVCGETVPNHYSDCPVLTQEPQQEMHTLKTPNATVLHHSDFSVIVIRPTDDLQGPRPIDLMDIKEIYAAFFRQYLIEHIEQMKPDDVIKLGYYVGEKYP